MGRGKARSPRFTGVLLVDKPLGPTSHDVVSWVRWALRERAVGHCGTLDPAASGLLILCVGEATKLVENFTGVDKRYHARFVLGCSTTTADAVGEILAEAPLPAGTLERAAEVLEEMCGELELPPPAYSAVRVDGRRAHTMARAGEDPKLAPRPMAIRQVRVGDSGLDEERGWIEAELEVSKGTYVRSLAEELGRRLGVPAHLGALRRLSCGALRVEDALGGLTGRRLDDPEVGGRPRWRVEIARDERQEGSGDNAEDRPESGPEQGAGHEGRSESMFDSASEPGEPAVGAQIVGAQIVGAQIVGDPEQGASRGSGHDARSRAAAAILAHLEAPWVWLPFPAVVLRGGAHLADFERLTRGQALDLDDALCGRLGLSRPDDAAQSSCAPEGPCALVEPSVARMILVEASHGQLTPRRLLRLDALPKRDSPPSRVVDDS
ncbi:tRNA pseudouridine(55) synthase TruB [Pseudenhygromyxa sp. WMMC2535]|uniref:tRNA pseudouridine(55) synthase TruB n=1 Tax=Pseudenhygromyxa sp. WMMC2535 TaxID=2712867 RepID=UPI0015582AFE|nr:tRNA pseudouridine(55) synthase TruB [Pseudenhygromyxa sp. WMMC2535]NVB41572.1 tRNA pseudouridine(55) synthase TruB [Pseudenhygromyxa sp. WMMC2535]